MRTFEEILAVTSEKKPHKRLAIVAPEDATILYAAAKAAELGLVDPVLYGDEQTIADIAASEKLKIETCRIVHCDNHSEAAKKAVESAKNNEADAIMKGSLHSSVLMRAVLNKEWGIRKSNTLSVVHVIDSRFVDRLLFMTDGGMVIAPTLEQKVDLIENAVDLAHFFGITEPKVACLAALENVNPNMSATMDAAVLSMMNQRGQIKGCIVDGPYQLDNAIFEHAVKLKKVKSPVNVAGQADIMLVPDIESGNIALKSARLLGGCGAVGFLMGAAVPIAMCSRSDSGKNKLYSIACIALFDN